MDFEEQFPSLKKNYPNELEEFMKNYMAVAVQEHCLDKSKVREIIEKIHIRAGLFSGREWKKILLKELGLND